MSEIKGMLVICDRCDNATIFLRHLKKEKTDGGYTEFDLFETLPPDWMYDVRHGYLCPQCASEFRTFVNGFFEGKSIAKIWRHPEYDECPEYETHRTLMITKQE